MSVDTWKKPHLTKYDFGWVAQFRGRIFIGKTPEDVMSNICRFLKWGNVLPCA